MALELNPNNLDAYTNCGSAKSAFSDKKGACVDYKIVSSKGKQKLEFFKSWKVGWCRKI